VLDDVEFSTGSVLNVRSGNKPDVIKVNDIVDFIPCSAAIIHPDNRLVAEGECAK
jgi:hypothetical protein